MPSRQLMESPEFYAGMASSRAGRDNDEAQIYAMLAIASAVSALAVAVEDRSANQD